LSGRHQTLPHNRVGLRLLDHPIVTLKRDTMVCYRLQSFIMLLLPEPQSIDLRLRRLHPLRIFPLNLQNVVHGAANLL